jgi:E3 ubiquitin-protein ligase UBR4
VEADNEGGTKLHDLRLTILEKLIQFVPRLSEVGGVRAIPFMQVSQTISTHHSDSVLGFILGSYILK